MFSPDVRYSHPPEEGEEGVLLLDHLHDVADRIKFVVPEGATTPSGDSLREVVRRLALVHDLGKATTWFQQYIDDDRRDPTPGKKRHHAPLGSFAAFYVLDDAGYDAETCLAGFVAVAKHHGRLPDVTEYVYKRTTADERGRSERLAILKEQAVDINDHASEVAEDVFEAAVGDRTAWRTFARTLLDSLVDEIGGHVTAEGQELTDALSDSCYALVLQCWSALVLADKTSAAGADTGGETYAAEQPTFQRLDEYVEGVEADASANPAGTRTERLNHYRSRARGAVLDNVATFAEEGGGVATLTLPTGMGKTLTGLSAALDLRDRLGGERVVYALPFTSVIDQVVDEVEGIYETDTTGRLLTAHHHLEETVIRDEEADEIDLSDDVAGMLGESWRAGLTVTTFVQFFESLAGPANRQSMKLPALRDSVVVLDEPQSLPLDWWKLVPRLVKILTEQYGATVVAMTATQPRLFEDAKELVDDPDAYFEAVKRVTYELDQSAERYLTDRTGQKSYADAAAELRETVETGDSALAVCNTIDSTRKLTDHLTEDAEFVDVAETYSDELEEVGDADEVDAASVAERVEAEGERAMLHLSTRLRPVDRLTLVETAKELAADGYALVTVSTQMVEAGVDISFDRVYRDLAPIDSIVQAAGRCNRSFERERGRVTVWWLDAPGDQPKTPAEAIYNRGVSLLPVAASALESVRDGNGDLTETDVARKAVKTYYDQLHEDRDVGKQTYADYVDDANADELGELSLIDRRRSVDVVVCRTDADRRIVEAVREARDEFDFEEVRNLLDETKSMRISVPVNRDDTETKDAINSLTPVIKDEGLYELDTDQHASFFDERTGFVVPESSVDHLFL